MGTISKNFSYREFEKSEIADRYGINNVVSSAVVRDALCNLVENVLQPLRDIVGKPLKINSGYRCQELNSLPEIGGSATSQHVKGEAADVAYDVPIKLAQMAVDNHLPFDQMILYPSFVHFSHKLNGKQRGQVLYNYRYKGPKIKNK